LDTLRELLVRRAARLQEWPAFSAPGWETLRYPAFRNRVEGVALGLMAAPPPSGRAGVAGAGAWGWILEVAVAVSGLAWDPDRPVDPGLLGGPAFNDEAGRQAYHDRGEDLEPETPFRGGVTHRELLARLARLNGKLGWDHDTGVEIPLADLDTDAARGALWSALFAGAHARLVPGRPGDWRPETFTGLF